MLPKESLQTSVNSEPENAEVKPFLDPSRRRKYELSLFHERSLKEAANGPGSREDAATVLSYFVDNERQAIERHLCG